MTTSFKDRLTQETLRFRIGVTASRQRAKTQGKRFAAPLIKPKA
jgi:hypothetical protein